MENGEENSILSKSDEFYVKNECDKVISNNKLTIKEKYEEIRKIFNKVAPPLGTTLQYIITAFLERLSNNDKNFQDLPKFHLTGTGRKLAPILLGLAFNVELFVIDSYILKDSIAYMQKKSELSALLQSPSDKKILIVFNDIEKGVFK